VRVREAEPERPDDALYAALGAMAVPPELRDLPDALAAARRGELPPLVREEELVAELHCHSDWSDGKATILEMATAALERGDRYMAITDHSAPYAMVGGLGDERLQAQAEEIDRVNAELAGAFTVLRGSEVEVGADGQLGLPDAVLARLDWAVASIHVAQKQDAATITRRIETAMRNPLIDVIGHPTSRRLLRRGRTKLDVARLVELAAETGTMLETPNTRGWRSTRACC
jgi:DNA polymerase (family 10)